MIFFAKCLFVLFLLGLILRPFTARRHSKDYSNHCVSDSSQPDGSIQPLAAEFFCHPPSEIGNLLYSHTTIGTQTRIPFTFAIPALVACLIGGGIGYVGAWVFSIESSYYWRCSVAFGLLFVPACYFLVPVRHVNCFVGTDGFSLHAARVWKNVGRFEITEDELVEFAHVVNIFPFNSDPLDLAFRAIIGEEHVKMRRWFPISSNQWDWFVGRVFDSFLDFRWSTALLRLTLLEKMSFDDHNPGIEFAIRASNEESDYELPHLVFDPNINVLIPLSDCHIVFTSKGLVIKEVKSENLIPQFDFLMTNMLWHRNKAIETPVTGVSVRQKFYKPHEVRNCRITDRIVEIVLTDRTLSVSIDRLPESPLLIRLIKSRIWTEGITSDIENSLKGSIGDSPHHHKAVSLALEFTTNGFKADKAAHAPFSPRFMLSRFEYNKYCSAMFGAETTLEFREAEWHSSIEIPIRYGKKKLMKLIDAPKFPQPGTFPVISIGGGKQYNSVLGCATALAMFVLAIVIGIGLSLAMG